MLWSLSDIRRRVVAYGPVQISRAELFLMCDDVEGMIAVLCDEVSQVVRTELEKVQLMAFLYGGDWYVAQIDQ